MHLAFGIFGFKHLGSVFLPLTICPHEAADSAASWELIALTVQGEVFEPASESSTTPEIAEKSAKGEDEENHLHDLIANPEDEAVKNLKPEALEGAKATTEMAGGAAAVLGEKLKSSDRKSRWPHGPHGGPHAGPHGPHGWHPWNLDRFSGRRWMNFGSVVARVRRLVQKQVVQKTQHLRELSEDGTSHWLLLVGLLGSEVKANHWQSPKPANSGFEHLKLNDVVVPGVLMDTRETWSKSFNRTDDGPRLCWTSFGFCDIAHWC